MTRKKSAFLLLLTTSLLFLLASQPRSKAETLLLEKSHAEDLPLLQLVGQVNVESKPNSMIIRCEGFRCSRYHELVYWGFDNKIYFLNAKSLAIVADPLITSDAIPHIRDERYLFYDRHYHQIYALDKYEQGVFPDGWYRLEVRIIRGYNEVASVPINVEANFPTIVDRYYPIDGAALQQPLINTGSVAKIFVDNPVNGMIDSVTFHGHWPDTALTTRLSYRTPLACATNPSYCSWHENPGSSLAIDAVNNIYIADNNDFMDRIVIYKEDGTPKPNFDHIGSLFNCFVEEAGLQMAPQEERLYLPAGCQSFANGSVAQFDLTENKDHQVIPLPYYDQGLLVDWYDQKRVFIATTDFYGDYDPNHYLYLHFLYDGQLRATLPIMRDYERGTLKAMTFDPYTGLLYLAVEGTIYMVKVNDEDRAEFPPLPEGEVVLTPDDEHDLIASDSSAIFHFTAASVNENARVTYKELPPAYVAGKEPQGLSTPETGLYMMRQFELTAVTTATATPLTHFNHAYQLKLAYSPQEIGPIIGGNSQLQLYHWTGDGWQQVGTTSPSVSETLLYIYTDLTGRFAIFGPTYHVYLPLTTTPFKN